MMNARVLPLTRPSPSIAEAGVSLPYGRTLLALVSSDPEIYARAEAAGMKADYLLVAAHRKAWDKIGASYAKDPDLVPPRHILVEADVVFDVEILCAGEQPVEEVVAQLAANYRSVEVQEHNLRASEAARQGDRETAREHLFAADELDRGEPWPQLLPLSGRANLQPFPVDCLPQPHREWVPAAAETLQVPVAMMAMLALGVLATACARRLKLHVHNDWWEVLCLFIAVVLPPASRKSAAYSMAIAPVRAYERELTEAIASEIAGAESIRNVAEQRLKNAQSIAAKADGPERIVAEQDAREAATDLQDAIAAIPVAPHLIMGDATPEAIGQVLGVQRDVAIMDAEGGGPIAVAGGRYNSGRSNFDIFLRGHNGDDVRIDRVGGSRPTVVLSPTITMVLPMQPDVLREVAEKREARGRGFVGRFLWCIPENTVGRRRSDPTPMPDRVKSAYEDCVRTLLELPLADEGERHVLELSGAAWTELEAFYNWIEPQLGPGGELESMSDWGGKLTGAIARIAALLHAAENAHAPWAAPISAETMRNAIQIGHFLLEHARAALGVMGADPVAVDAARILERLKEKRVTTIKRRDLHRQLQSRFSSVRKMEPALDLLVEYGWIRVRSVRARGASAQEVIYIDLNPAALGEPAARSATDPFAPSRCNDMLRFSEAGE